jgi:FAD/FMN-containing dehydrogenase
VFWALRGGGAGSWGVIVNATFKTYPAFNATQSTVLLTANGSAAIGAVTEAHARHVFDLDVMKAGQFYGVTLAENTTYDIGITTVFPNATSEQAVVALAPILDDLIKAGGVLVVNTTTTANINELLAQSDDQAGLYGVTGSRLIPESSYRQSPEAIGEVYKRLADAGTFEYVKNFSALIFQAFTGFL